MRERGGGFGCYEGMEECWGEVSPGVFGAIT